MLGYATDLQQLYFVFRYDYNTGNTTEDLITRELMMEFLATKLPNDLALRDDGSTISFTGHSDRLFTTLDDLSSINVE